MLAKHTEVRAHIAQSAKKKTFKATKWDFDNYQQLHINTYIQTEIFTHECYLTIAKFEIENFASAFKFI